MASAAATARRDQRPERDRSADLPHSPTHERAIIGGILYSPGVLAKLPGLEPRHMFDLRARATFEAIRNLDARSVPIDLVTIEGELARVGKTEAVGDYLSDCALAPTIPDNVVEYAKTVRRHHLIREVMSAAANAVVTGARFADDPDEFLDEHIAGLQRLRDEFDQDGGDKIPLISAGQALEELDRIAAAPRFPTPWDEVNGAIGFGGLLGGQVYYLVGGTGAGKTSWIGQLVRHTAEQGGSGLIAFWELFSAYYVARITAPVLGVHSNAILDGRIAPREVAAAFPPRVMLLDRPSLPTLARAVAKVIETTGRPPLVIVDYLQLLSNAIMATQARPDPRLATAQASAALGALAAETGAALVVVSAAGRSSARKLTSSDVRKLSPVDLVDSSRESGQVEFDGGGIVVLSVSDEKDGDEDIATMTIAKARFGERCHIDARFAGASGGWRALCRVVRVPDAEVSPSAAAQANEVRAAIVRVLRHAGPTGSKNKVAKMAGKNRQAVMSEIDAMIDDGSIEYRGGLIVLAGVYQASKEPASGGSQLEISGGAK